jgi:hypothetical protein
MPCSWRECVTAFAEHQPWLNQSDKALIMGRGMADWIGWRRADWSQGKSAPS